MREKVRLIAVITFTAIIFVTGLVFIIGKHFESKVVTIPIENKQLINNAKPIITEQVNNINNESLAQIPGSMPQPAVSPFSISPGLPIPTINATNIDDSFGSITISTTKKTRTYDIISDVEEATLINNIGWLPGSAVPGKEGLCILMGHRDTDFRILKDIEIGDRLIISKNGQKYTYQITRINIAESDNELRFEAQEGKLLVLVTCYPFRYSGHAPQKLIVYAKRI